MMDWQQKWEAQFLRLTIFVAFVREGFAGAPAHYLLSPSCHTLEYWKNSLLPKLDNDLIHTLPDSSTMQVNGSLRLHLVNNPTLYAVNEVYICKVSFIAAHMHHRILLSWSYMEVGEDKGGNSWVHVLDSESHFDLSSPMWGRREKVPDFHSIGEGLTLAYRGHPALDSLSVIFTEFRDIQQNDTCLQGLYKCNGLFHYCIPGWLHCDGYNNCGSTDTDETKDCEKIVNDPLILPKSGSSVGLVGALLGILVTILLVTAVGISIYICKRRITLRRRWLLNQPRGLRALSHPLKISAPENEYSAAPGANVAIASGYQQGQPLVPSYSRNGFVLEPVVSYITDDDYTEILSDPADFTPAGQQLIANNNLNRTLDPANSETSSALSSADSISARQPLIPPNRSAVPSSVRVTTADIDPAISHIYAEPDCRVTEPSSSRDPCTPATLPPFVLPATVPPMLKALGKPRFPPRHAKPNIQRLSTDGTGQDHFVLLDLDRPVGEQVIMSNSNPAATATTMKPDSVPCRLTV